MKAILLNGLLAMFVLRVSCSQAQTTLYQDSFSSQNNKGALGPGNTYDTVGISGWTIDVSNCTLGASNEYFKVKKTGVIGRFEGKNLDGEAVWYSDIVDITNYTTVSLFVDITQNNALNFESGDYINLYYKLNGGSEISFAQHGLNSGPIIDTLNAAQAGLNGSSVQIVIRVKNNANNEKHRFLNVRIQGLLPGNLAAISNPVITDKCFTTLDLSWALPIGFNPGSSDILVFAKAGSAVNTGVPSQNIAGYTADPNFAGSGSIYENDPMAKCVYKGDGSSFQITGLSLASGYHFLFLNASGTTYSPETVYSSLTLSAPKNVVDTYATVTGSGSIALSFGNPTFCFTDFLIVARAGSPVNSGTPAGDGSSYTANATYGIGTPLLGGYVVYKGNGNNASTTGLTAGTVTYFKIFTREGTHWSSGIDVSAVSNAIPMPGTVYITEHAKPSASTNARYLEIYNASGNDISMDGSKIIRYQSDGVTPEYVFDFSTEGDGTNILPANGYLILSRNLNQSAFESFWGISLSGLPDAVHFNNTAKVNFIGAKRVYLLKHGGTPDTDDGTIVDAAEARGSGNQVIFQTPYNNWEGNFDAATNATPGYFGFYDNPNNWQLSFFNGNWANGVVPSATTSGDNLIIKKGNATLSNNSAVNHLRIRGASSVSLTSETITVNGNLTIEEGGAVQITSSGSVNVSGTSSIVQNGVMSSLAFNVWSTPFMGNINILSTFSGANPCDIYCYKASTQVFKYDYNVPFSTTCNGNPVTFSTNHIIAPPEGNPDGNFDIGRGYFIPGSPLQRTFSSSGALNNGTISIPIYGSDANTPTGWAGNDWNLIGNPYPSGLNTKKFINANSSFINAIYIYNGSTGSYETYNNSDSYKVAALQGFFVDANTTTTGILGNIVFTNNMRSANNNTFRAAYQALYLRLSHSDKNERIRVYLSDDSSDGRDKVYDAQKFPNDHGFNFASVIDGRYYVFNGLKTPEHLQQKIVPLYLEINESGNYQITLDSTRAIPAGLSILLEDKATGTTHDLRQNKAFEFYANSGTSLANRFYLKLALDENITAIAGQPENEDIGFYVANKVLHFRYGNKIKALRIYTISGTLIFSGPEMSNKQSMSLQHFSTGTYIVEATLTDGTATSQKIVLK